MAERFELSDLEDVSTFLELVEDSGDTAFITIGGRDRYVVVAAPKYANLRAEALQAEKRTVETDARIADLEAQLAEAQSKITSLELRNMVERESAPVVQASAVASSASEGDATSLHEVDEAREEDSRDTDPVSTSQPSSYQPSGVCGSEPYVSASLPNTPIDSDDYQRSMWQEAITERMKKVIEAEAPIEKQRLFNTVRGSFGIKRSGRDIQAHNEWLFNRNIDAKQTEFNGSTFVWRNDQDPDTYCIFRPSDDESGRQITEFAYQELAAAMMAALKQSKSLSRDELIEATMRLLGYKRKTTRVRDVIGAAIEQASNDGIIKLFTDGTFRA